jgi:hypothetical protein
MRPHAFPEMVNLSAVEPAAAESFSPDDIRIDAKSGVRSIDRRRPATPGSVT